RAAPGAAARGVGGGGGGGPLPRRGVVGVPADLDDLARCRLLSAAGMARAREDARLPVTPRGDDVDVAGYVGARFGRGLVDRLVDPPLGGGHAGGPGGPSCRAAPPPLARG